MENIFKDPDVDTKEAEDELHNLVKEIKQLSEQQRQDFILDFEKEM